MEKSQVSLELGRRYVKTYPEGKKRIFRFYGGNPPMVRFEDNGSYVELKDLGDYTSIEPLP